VPSRTNKRTARLHKSQVPFLGDILGTENSCKFNTEVMLVRAELLDSG